MTGGSLGLRTGSYGSLQQQQLHNGTALPIQPSQASARKPAKMLPPGPRDKERVILPWICKLCGRRKVGMLLLFVASVAVIFSFVSVLNKEEDAPEGLETNMSSSDHVWTIVNYGRKSPIAFSHPSVSRKVVKENITSFGNGGNETQIPALNLSPSVIPAQHPCENFPISSAPPPPGDRRRLGPRPCPVCYVPVELAMAYVPALPSDSPILKNLTYFVEENSTSNESNGGSSFGGHPTLEQRNISFDIKESMTVHCGFVRGKKPGQSTGFDINDEDFLEMEKCQGVVVASAIFGNYDIMQQPKNISEASQRTICFYMFVDEETEAYIRNSSIIDSNKRVGLWRVVVVRNLPYADARRNGKVPKLLLHRLFPNAQFSLWIDGKLELVVDPYQVLERFLWQRNSTFAISRHYRRFDVFEEAEANKAAGKYDNTSIDYQIEFYRREGLTPYSEAKLPITSDVPEGCVIIREHIPITNLFTCLWFNEVDRFTSRDQLSFSTVRDKIMSRVNWTVDMFMDCERRNFVIQAYHRDLLEQRIALAASSHPPPLLQRREAPIKPASQDSTVKAPPMKKLPIRHRRSGSRRHRLKAGNNMKDAS
ncbi:hypothetical protein AXF42_Ash005689 [Apostasia shenzhenica]|uniref:TOD1/MUCI70 glycosyltransferase-like domain-containing protein n=1 Tax=Apostasia shenzhenica TaxID=1088818 RepID=A0A2I0BC28_9ASPA|nr:hypothetical protein AXF42_Ash005689 [Apostasia shenzhenica]